MSPNTSVLLSIVLWLGAATAQPARAQPATNDAPRPNDSQQQSPGGAPEEENYRGIRYLTGGVGVREQEYMRALEGDYNLKIVMSSEDGAYLAGVELAFRDAQGNDVFLATSEGPFFFIDLPDGRYEVTARRPSAPIERRQVRIHGERAQKLHFSLPPQGG